MTEPTFNILFLRTGNSVRSQMAEALANGLGKGRFHAYSAGSRPSGFVQPLAIAQIKALGFPAEKLRSKSWGWI
ncbi:MAG TPA: hypothetical protein VGH80_10985 [Xanthomonadaceae bacterium]|jgi:arsenate reductase